MLGVKAKQRLVRPLNQGCVLFVYNWECEKRVSVKPVSAIEGSLLA